MINLLIRQEEFSKAISEIISVCEQTRGPDKGGLPHFFYIRIEGSGEAVKLSANNMSRKIDILVRDVTPHEPFVVGVKGPHLKYLVSALPRGMISLSIGDNGKITVGSGKSEYELWTVERDAFPDYGECSIEKWAPANLGEMLELMARISYCSSNADGADIYKKAVTLTHDHMICTDGYRLCSVPNMYMPCSEPLLFPAEAARCFYSLFKGVDSGRIFTDGSRIHFSSEGIYASSALLSGRVPNFRSVMQQSEACCLVKVSAADFKAVIGRAATFTSSIDKSNTTAGEFVFSKEGLTINIDSQGYKATEVIPVEDGVDIRMNLNLKFVQQAMRTLGEGIVLEIRGPEMPIVFKDESGLIRNIIVPQKRTR